MIDETALCRILNWNLQDWVPENTDPKPEDYKGLPFVNKSYYDEPVHDGWAEADSEIRCIWSDQIMTKPGTLTHKLYLHRFGWYHGCMIYQASTGTDAEMLYKEIRSHEV